MMIPLMFLMRLLSESEEREPRMMMAQKLLVFRPRNQRKTSLKHPTLTACQEVVGRAEEEEGRVYGCKGCKAKVHWDGQV